MNTEEINEAIDRILQTPFSSDTEQLVRDIVNQSRDGYDVLSFLLSASCRKDRLSLLKFLIKEYYIVSFSEIELADTNATLHKLQKREKTAFNRLLMSACYYGRVDIARYLIEEGASLRCCEPVLNYAIFHQHGAVVRLLIESGIKTNDKTSYYVRSTNRELRKYLVSKGVQLPPDTELIDRIELI